MLTMTISPRSSGADCGPRLSIRSVVQAFIHSLLQASIQSASTALTGSVFHPTLVSPTPLRFLGQCFHLQKHWRESFQLVEASFDLYINSQRSEEHKFKVSPLPKENRPVPLSSLPYSWHLVRSTQSNAQLNTTVTGLSKRSSNVPTSSYLPHPLWPLVTLSWPGIAPSPTFRTIHAAEHSAMGSEWSGEAL